MMIWGKVLYKNPMLFTPLLKLSRCCLSNIRAQRLRNTSNFHPFFQTSNNLSTSCPSKRSGCTNPCKSIHYDKDEFLPTHLPLREGTHQIYTYYLTQFACLMPIAHFRQRLLVMKQLTLPTTPHFLHYPTPTWGTGPCSSPSNKSSKLRSVLYALASTMLEKYLTSHQPYDHLPLYMQTTT